MKADDTEHVGHLLVATRAHRQKVADMESRESQEIGESTSSIHSYIQSTLQNSYIKTDATDRFSNI
jgi:diadenosine tetraphosphate (Ap4A) HIT family hydrolase